MKSSQIKHKTSPLVFSTSSYPKFGRSRLPFNEEKPLATVTNSPYFWWFMFLRLNEDYKATCKANGVGKCAKLYKDLGDVHKVNFKEWWKEKAPLFAEPKRGYKMAIATDISEVAPFNNEEVVNLVVPLTWTQRSLKKAFNSLILKRIEKGKRGVSVVDSEAKYKLGSRWNIEALSIAYKIYLLKKSAMTEDKKVSWADIGIRAELPYAKEHKAKEGIRNKFTTDIRATLTILTNRHYKRAEEFIKNAITPSFPYKN